MILREVIRDDLGCTSHLVGDEEARVAAVVDPKHELTRWLRSPLYLRPPTPRRTARSAALTRWRRAPRVCQPPPHRKGHSLTATGGRLLSVRRLSCRSGCLGDFECYL